MSQEINTSLWAKAITASQFQALGNDGQCDVAIVGGGFSGLWLAFHLLQIDASLSISIFEARHIGFGASGRNGGWVSAQYPVSKESLIKRHGESKTAALTKALKESIDEIGNFARQNAKGAHFIKGGSLTFARNSAQASRLQSYIDSDHQWLTASEVKSKINIAGALGAIFTPYCAAIDPMGLLQGVAGYLRQVGVLIYENSPVGKISNGQLQVLKYRVSAPKIITATEAFRAPSRNQIPLYSLMVATQPLSDSIWNEIGNQGRATFAEGKHLVNYAQRTADNRLAIGGRGARYPFRSKQQSAFEHFKKVHSGLRDLARSWFPILQDTTFTHAWGGAIAITRDWEPFARWDKSQGYGELGGYAGDGVTMSYLASKTLAGQIMEVTSDLNGLHFLSHQSKKWEVEPIRYAAVNALVKLSGVCDAEEAITGRASLINKVITPLVSR